MHHSHPSKDNITNHDFYPIWPCKQDMICSNSLIFRIIRWKKCLLFVQLIIHKTNGSAIDIDDAMRCCQTPTSLLLRSIKFKSGLLWTFNRVTTAAKSEWLSSDENLLRSLYICQKSAAFRQAWVVCLSLCLPSFSSCFYSSHLTNWLLSLCSSECVDMIRNCLIACTSSSLPGND